MSEELEHPHLYEALEYFSVYQGVDATLSFDKALEQWAYLSKYQQEQWLELATYLAAKFKPPETIQWVDGGF